MSELIDRQALKAAHGLGTDCADCKRDARSCQYDRDFSRMDFCEWIDDAPTASPWHRVEERLPEKDEWVLTKEEIKTIRIHMNAFKETLCNQHRYNEAQWYQDLVDKLAKMEVQE